MTETALYRYATPHFYTIDDFPEAYRDFTISAFYPSPWKGGWWRLRDAVDYCLTASKAVLQTAAVYRAGAALRQVPDGARHDRAVQEGAALRVDHPAGPVGPADGGAACSPS